MAGDQSISLLKDEPPGADAYGWVFGGLDSGNSFLVSFYTRAFSAEACNLYYSSTSFSGQATNTQRLDWSPASHPGAGPAKGQAYTPQSQSEETEPNLGVKSILGREKVSLTGHNRYKLLD